MGRFTQRPAGARSCAILVVTFALAACDAGRHEVRGQQPGEPPVAAGSEWRTDFSRHTVPLEEIVSGGVPRDGIPAIDAPTFESVDEADRWLDRRDPVAVVEEGGEVKAYPLQILIYHEIVNDRVGGRPVAVTYCPLCNTTLAFDRRFGSLLLDFGTTGRLRHSDLVMYDRQTETWWQQATGDGIVGEHAGEELTFVPAPVLSWSDVRRAHPGAAVLSRETGYERPYGHNPYVGYDRREGPISAFFDRRADDRLPRMERVVGLHREGDALALPFSRLAGPRVAHVEIGGDEVVVFWAEGTASAVDAREISDGREVGSSAVFLRELDGQELTFVPVEGRSGLFRDRETESVWGMSGRAQEGPLAGRSLHPVTHGNHFWFAWAAFRPNTDVWDG